MKARTNRLTVGLYFGTLSHCSGLWRHWAYLLKRLNLEWIPLWDHSFLLKDILNAVDVIVVPGGFGRSGKNAFGGETGRGNLRAAVKRGVSFLGICYGAQVGMASGAEKGICRLGLIQGRMLGPRGLVCRGVVRIDYLGGPLNYCVNAQETAHINGRMFGKGDYKVFGRFSMKQPGPFELAPQKEIAGRPAAITGHHGRGKVFLFSSHPGRALPGQYEAVLAEVAAGKLKPSQALHRCWNPPKVSRANMRLLKGLFRVLPRVATQQYCPVTTQWSAEQITYLSTAKELLGSRLDEIEQQLLPVLSDAKTAALRFARDLTYRRLRQGRYILRGIDANKLWYDPSALARTATCFTLQKIYCECDQPNFIKEARFDFLISQAQRLRSARGSQRARLEKKAAELTLKHTVRDLDTFVYLGRGSIPKA